MATKDKPRVWQTSEGSWYGMFGTAGSPIYLGAWNRATKAQALKRLKAKTVKNPAKKSFPVGKFVKVQAVRVNRNGTVTVKTLGR